MKKLIVILFIGLTYLVNAQDTDYLNIRKDLYQLGCGQESIDTIKATYLRLKAIDTAKIVDNIYLYYKDLSFCCFQIWGHDKDSTYSELTIEYCQKSIYHNPTFFINYLNLAVIYRLFGNCEKVEENIKKYKFYAKKKELDRKQIKYLKEACNL